MSIQALRERRNAATVEARKLLDERKDKAFEPEHQSRYEELMTSIDNIDAQITREQRLLDAEASNKFDRHDVNVHDKADHLGERAMAAAWLRNGERGFNAEQMAKYLNTMSTTTGSEGGYAVQSDVAASIIDAMKDYSGVRQVATIISTAQGNPLSYPTTNGTSETGELIAQNTTATDADITFDTVSLAAYKFSSKIVTVPIELLQDATIDIEALVRRRFAERLGRVTNTFFTTGSGNSQPAGIVTRSAAGKVGTTGQATTIIFEDIVDLMEAVDVAYLAGGNNVGFMCAQPMRALLRKLKDQNGRPIWTPSYDAGLSGKAPDMLMGHPVFINNSMASPGASNKTLLFGDMSKYVVRDVMGMSLFRFTDSAYTKLGQVGFLAWMRTGGNLLDTGAVKHYQHST